MTKYHNLISIGIGLLYLIILQKFSIPQPIFRFLIPAVLGFSLLASAYNFWYLRQIQKYNFWIVLRQFLMFLSGFGVLSLITSAGLKGLFLVLTVALIVVFEYTLENFAENLLMNQTLIVSFGIFISLAAYSQYFPALSFTPFFSRTSPAWQLSLQPVYLAGLFAGTFLLTRSFFENIPQSSRIKLINSLAIALFCTEVFWALAFLPFHYSALAILLFNVFYFCLILDYYYLFQTLNFKKIQFHLLLVLICSGLVLLATPWKVVN